MTCPMSRSTPATIALAKVGVAFDLATYDYDPGSERVGLQAAEALGEDPARVLKTLVVLLDGKPACVVLPSDREVSMKKLAAALGGKSAAMMPVPDAERITGYKVGGVSPFGQKKRLPTAVEEAVLAQPYVFVNGGQRGLQMRLAPADLVAALGAKAASIVA
jgi:Cys-tRNA(Pro)/Cys-tRNA(Cys) deacylase